MTLAIRHADIHLIDLQTRLPFKYGIATMTETPHCFVRVVLDVDGRESIGIAADHLPPKWFTKVPEKSLEAEFDEMLRVIEHAVAEAPGIQGETPYGLWRALDERQRQWGNQENLPPLLSNFGTSFLERAVMEAFLKTAGQSFAEALRAGSLGGDFDRQLDGLEPAALLPEKPRDDVIARHTVGMADPLTAEEIPPEDRLDDGLPQALDECIEQYALVHFKIKVTGDVESDLHRLRQIFDVIDSHAADDYAFSLDGNERFRTLEEFQRYWQSLAGVVNRDRLLFVEQPFHRDVALDRKVLGGLREWTDRPPLIIDESDAEWDSLSRAIALGYHGTSHKNCKGVFRGIAHASLLAKRQQEEPSTPYVMSGEDLATIGPVALLQDLAVAASLGIASIERNGHHYFAGLSAFPETVQQDVLENHNDLYFLSTAGWPTVDVQDGLLDLRSVIAAPLGVGFELDVEQFTPAAAWRRQRLG